MHQEAQIGAELFFRRAFGRGADNESARGFAALVHQNPLEAMALFVGGDLAADAHVRDRRHEDQEAAGQRDVAGDARALLGDGLLGDLNQDLLAGLQQVADDGQVGGLHGAARGSAAAVALLPCGSAATASAAAAIAALLRLALAAGGGGLAFGGRLLPLRLRRRRIFVVLAALVVEVQLDAVVEVGFLQHFAQVAGANLRGQRLLFVVVQVVLVGLVR